MPGSNSTPDGEVKSVTPPSAVSTPVVPEAAQGTIVDRVMEDFLSSLAKGDFDPKITDRLRAALSSKQDVSSEAIRTALFGDETLP